jgi:RNA binding exosome subunit
LNQKFGNPYTIIGKEMHDVRENKQVVEKLILKANETDSRIIFNQG